MGDVVKKYDPPSDEFEDAFIEGGHGCMRICRCGRTCFDVCNHWDWEDGELERLKQREAESPDLYVSMSYGISCTIVDGKEFVMGCPCNGARPYEDFILNNAEKIARYLNAQAKILNEKAKRMWIGEGPVA